MKTTDCQKATVKAWLNISSLLGLGLQSSRTHTGQVQNLQLGNEPRTASLPSVPLKMLKKIALKESVESYWLGASSGSFGVSHCNESLEDGYRFELPGVHVSQLCCRPEIPACSWRGSTVLRGGVQSWSFIKLNSKVIPFSTQPGCCPWRGQSTALDRPTADPGQTPPWFSTVRWANLRGPPAA